MDVDLTGLYFKTLNATLKKHPRAIPSLLVDLDLVDHNIEAFKQYGHQNMQIRISVKSLPSPDFINYLMTKMKTARLMVFHQPFLSELSRTSGEKIDILLGKPMPISTAKYYFDNLPKTENGFDPFTQIQWLIDSQNRLNQYIDLAKTLNKKLRLNLEIDVGLHRGGFQHLDELHMALQQIAEHQTYVSFSGFMGYDPHVVKIPKLFKSRRKSLEKSTEFYDACKQMVLQNFPALWNDHLTFNGSGSSTLALHNRASPLNDITAGSCFVKPTTFDISTLSTFKPACYIATPVLKKFEGTRLPGLERFKSFLSFMIPKYGHSFFIYGGYWKADYVYPKGISANALFGESTNQTMINAPVSVDLRVDDFVFLRPHQSEFVFLQFGKLKMVRGKEIFDEWSILKND